MDLSISSLKYPQIRYQIKDLVVSPIEDAPDASGDGFLPVTLQFEHTVESEADELPDDFDYAADLQESLQDFVMTALEQYIAQTSPQMRQHLNNIFAQTS